MHALKTLDILRPSRPSSPAPPSTQVTHSTANGTTQQPTVAANGELKNRSRSLSRQLTDKVAGLHLNTGVLPASATVVSPDGMNGKKDISPPSSRAATPRIPAATLPADAAAPAGAAYMDVLGLRLSDAVNKASAGVDYKAKKGFKKGNGWSVGEVVVKELPYPPNDAYLIRAVLRTSVRSLSIYITRLESLLLPALTDPSFLLPLTLAHISPLASPLNPSQAYAISIAHAAWETCEVLEQTLDTGNWPKFVSEALRPVMDKLDLVVGKVTQPLLISLKRDLIASLGKNEGASPPGGKVIALATIPNPTIPSSDVPVKKEPSNQPISRLTKEPSQPGVARSLAIPIALQHFASRIDGARKVLDLIAVPCADDGEAWITNVVVAVVWKGMCVMAEKEHTSISNRPPSPTSVSRALHSLGKERDSTPAVVSDRIMAPSLAKLATNPLSILPSRSASRAPSPPRASRIDPDTHALMSLEGLVKRLVGGLVPPPLSPDMTPDPNATEHLAREALHEALEALTSLRIVTASMNGPSASSRTLASLRRIRDDIDDIAEEALDDAWEDLPAITVFAILSRQANVALSILPFSPSEKTQERVRLRSASEVWGWSKVEYERQVLSGFGAAEEWGRKVALAYKGEVERVLGELTRLQASGGEKPGKEIMEAVEWTRGLGVALEARGGVKLGSV